MGKLFFFTGEALRAIKRNVAPTTAAVVTTVLTALLLGVLIPVFQTAQSKGEDVRGQLELARAHQLDVLQILRGELRHLDVEHVEVVLADEVEQQVERALECLEEHFQCVGGDVEILGDYEDGFAVDAGDGRWM